MTRLTRMEASLVITAAISPTGKTVKAIDTKQKTADEYPDEKKIPTQTARLGLVRRAIRAFEPAEWLQVVQVG